MTLGLLSYHSSKPDELRYDRTSTFGPHPGEQIILRIKARSIRDQYAVPTYAENYLRIQGLSQMLTIDLFFFPILYTVLSCAATPDPQIRIIINDGVTALTGIAGCPENKDGLCPVDVFVKAQKQTISETDWNWSCHGDWTVPAGTGWNTTNGTPPRNVAAHERR